MALTSLRSWSPSGSEQATAFFLSNFVLGADGPTEGHLERILQIDYEADEHLLASMRAVGFAGLSGSFHDPALLRDARKNYITAVERTNVAIRSPDQVKQDSTLLAVLILGLFEKVAGGDRESSAGYEYHVKGAAAILKVRGREQLNSPEGRRIFIQVTSALLSLCMQQEMHVPASILELREEPSIRADVSKLESMQVLDMTITFVEFSASVKDGSISDPSYIVARALEIDRYFKMIFFNAPMSWRYKTVYDANADPRFVFAGCYHEYDSFWTARMWNVFRVVRLSLHTDIRNTLSKKTSASLLSSVSLEYSAQLHESRNVMRIMQADILASVPEYMGHHFPQPWPFNFHHATSGQHSVGEGTTGKQLVRVGTLTDKSLHREKMVSHGQYIMLPLYKAGMVDVDESTKAGRLWSLQMLQYIGQVVGIRHALTFAAIIERSIQ
jgi:Fungal specific transcription factor domain